MGLESASYPNQLVATNPTGSDQKSTADDHIRLLKSVIQTTFPNITGAITAAQADLNKVGVTQPQTSNDTSVSSTAFVQTAVASAITAIGAGASMWVSGTTYALGNVVWSPSNYQTYRRIIAGAGTTDPASDATNWVLVSGNVQTTATQTLTNKTLDAPVITGGASISGNVSVVGAISATAANTATLQLSTTGTLSTTGSNYIAFKDTIERGYVGYGAGNSKFTVSNSVGPIEIASSGGSCLLDTSGNLVVGSASALLTTAGRGNITVNGAGSSLLALGVGGAAIGYIYAVGSTVDVVNNSTGALRFYTNSGNTQAGQFDASGNLLVGTTSGSYNYFRKDNASNYAVGISNASTSDGYCLALFSASASSTSWNLIDGYANGSWIFRVAGNGNVQNTNNSYGAISDIKLKQDITDATPKLAKLLKVRIVNYKFKSDPDGIKQIGVIAQELEEISPGLIEETPDFEEVTLTREVEKTVPVTIKKEVTTERVQLDVVDGVAVQTVIEETSTINEPVVDEYPVFDGYGNPVMEVVTPATEAEIDDKGNEVKAALPAVLRQKIHAVPRMETVVEKEEYKERRLTGTTTKSVKYSIFVPMLIKAMQEHVEETRAGFALRDETIAALTARIEALEARA